MRRIKHFGGQHETRPIKDVKQLEDLMFYLQGKVERAKTPVKRYQADRNWCLILIGINTAFRAEDLLQLRVVDVSSGYVSIKENKTGKPQNFKLNKNLYTDIMEYIKRNDLTTGDYLFRGQKKTVNGKMYILPITRQQGHKIVSSSGKAIGIPYVFGLHSLRKTFGYQFIANGGQILTLMKMYNHDSPDITLRYVCWGQDDVEKTRESVYLGGTKKKKK